MDAEPKEIELHGLGLFGCRTDAWPGFNPRFCGFGGEEGYLHEKFRRRGDRTLCLPFLRWWHLFRDSSTPPPYSLPNSLRIRNYLIGFSEVEKPWDEILKEFAGTLEEKETINLQMEFGDTPEKWESLKVLAKV